MVEVRTGHADPAYVRGGPATRVGAAACTCDGITRKAKHHVGTPDPQGRLRGRAEGPLVGQRPDGQYQRMCHYGIAGFGTAATYARALGMTEQSDTLKAMVSDIYKADEYASRLAQGSVKAAAAAA